MGHLPSKLNSESISSKSYTKKLMKFRFKRKKKNKTKIPKVPEISEDLSQVNPANENNDIEAIKIMQDQLAFNSDTFVLNQMMMSVQFFGNFER